MDLACLFGRKAPAEIEIGAGRGDFLIGYGLTHPELNLLGIERKTTILKRAAGKIRKAKVTNVVLLNTEVRKCIEESLPPACAQAVHVYFPDPWPKRRHAIRRFFYPPNLELLFKVLMPGGLLHVRTDVQPYFKEIMGVLNNHPAFQQTETPPDVLEHQTGYERRFLLHNLPIYRASFIVNKFDPPPAGLAPPDRT